MKKAVLLPVAVSSIFLSSAFAFAYLPGKWVVGGPVKMTITAKKERPVKVTDYFFNTLHFQADHDFIIEEMIDDLSAPGIWKQKKRTFSVKMPETAALENYFEELFAANGLDIDVFVRKFTLTGAEKAGGGYLHGQLSIDIKLFYNDYNKPGSISFRYTFDGDQQTQYLSESRNPDRSDEDDRASLLSEVGRIVLKAVKASLKQ